MPITIKKGKTFSRVLRPTAPPFIYRPITAITKAAPVGIKAVGHGLVNGQYVAVVSVKGMAEINVLRPLNHTSRATLTISISSDDTPNSARRAAASSSDTFIFCPDIPLCTAKTLVGDSKRVCTIRSRTCMDTVMTASMVALNSTKS